MNVVISQPMFIPWVGLFEQIRLADVFVHYDDVQMPRGRSFVSRVQIKTEKGQKWLSAQVDKRASGKLISETVLNDSGNWRNDHLNLLKVNYKAAPHCELMLDIASKIYSFSSRNIARFNQHAIEYLAGWLGLETQFSVSRSYPYRGSALSDLSISASIMALPIILRAMVHQII